MTASSRNPGEILEVCLRCAPPLPVSIPVYILGVSTYQTTLCEVSFQTVFSSGYVMKESAAATPCSPAAQSARKVDTVMPFMLCVSPSGRRGNGDWACYDVRLWHANGRPYICSL